jgi:hypothetical protein
MLTPVIVIAIFGVAGVASIIAVQFCWFFVDKHFDNNLKKRIKGGK